MKSTILNKGLLEPKEGGMLPAAPDDESEKKNLGGRPRLKLSAKRRAARKREQTKFRVAKLRQKRKMRARKRI